MVKKSKLSFMIGKIMDTLTGVVALGLGVALASSIIKGGVANIVFFGVLIALYTLATILLWIVDYKSENLTRKLIREEARLEFSVDLLKGLREELEKRIKESKDCDD